MREKEAFKVWILVKELYGFVWNSCGVRNFSTSLC